MRRRVVGKLLGRGSERGVRGGVGREVVRWAWRGANEVDGKEGGEVCEVRGEMGGGKGVMGWFSVLLWHCVEQ